jgi:hypothetical protein
MEVFLLIDPVGGRREPLKRFLEPRHQVVEYESLPDCVASCQGRNFKAAFLAWPECLRGREIEKVNWSCECVVLLVQDGTFPEGSQAWCKRVLPNARIAPMDCSNGYLNVKEMTRALRSIFDRPLPEPGDSTVIWQQLRDLATRVAANDLPVLLCGEPGTGKETIARWIHAHSERGKAGAPFESFHCSGLEPSAAFSELFGHEKGAFPWAAKANRGLLAAADQGTLYIHEVCDLDKAIQFKILRLLQRPIIGIERLGGEEAHLVNVRFISATRWQLRQRLGTEFSEELFYLLKQNYVEIPPLRSRAIEVPQLAQDFLARCLGDSIGSVTWEPGLLAALQEYSWPGNLNELEAAVKQAVLHAGPSGELKFEHLPQYIRQAIAQPVWAVPESPYGTGHEAAKEAATVEAPVSASPAPTVHVQPNLIPDDFPAQVNCDGYRTISIIGTTRFTRVFLAERELNGDLVILKLLRLQVLEQLQAIKKAMALNGKRREGREFMIPVHHANTYSQGSFHLIVVACLDESVPEQEIDRNLYQPKTFQRWLEVRSMKLSSSLQERREVLDLLMRILDVLDFFHRNELVMNDVKPANFGFYQGRLVAIDYGGITFLGQKPHEHTPGYGPPETEPRRATPGEDVLAVVQMMAEALYRLPRSLLQPEHAEAHGREYAQEGTLFDKLAWTIICKGLNPNPKLRFQDAASMKKELEELRQRLTDQQ